MGLTPPTDGSGSRLERDQSGCVTFVLLLQWSTTGERVNRQPEGATYVFQKVAAQCHLDETSGSQTVMSLLCPALLQTRDLSSPPAAPVTELSPACLDQQGARIRSTAQTIMTSLPPLLLLLLIPTCSSEGDCSWMISSF